jgi:hypothetical protein
VALELSLDPFELFCMTTVADFESLIDAMMGWGREESKE